VPERCTLEVRFACYPGEDLAAVQARFRDGVLRACAADDWLREHPPRVTYGSEVPAAEVDPGHPLVGALVAAAVVAARGHLDIAEVVIVAWAGAVAGGLVGWWVGLRGGRALVVRPGPLHRVRLRALARGERFYDRFGLLAVYLTPTWMAGVARMSAARFLPANAFTSLLWALAIGVGAYFAGPPVVDFVHDVGFAGLAVAVPVAAAAGALERRRRRRRSAPADSNVPQ
jgi:membrane protein DedA with SNARE-associated domain